MSQFDSNPDNISGLSDSLDAVRQQTEKTTHRAIQSNESTLLASPPSSGKTTSIFKIASETDEEIVYLAQREDLYEQGVEKSEKFGCSYKLIPSPFRDCDSFDESSSLYDPEAVALYQLGVGVAKIHHHKDLDCGDDCEYLQKWKEFDINEDVDVIIGHYKHAYLSPIIEDRVVIIDEFPEDAFERKFNNSDTMITRFLQSTNQVPFDDFMGLIENRDDLDRFETAYAWFCRNGVGTDDKTIIEADEKDRYHTLAPFLTYIVLNTVKTDNGFEIPWFNLTGIEAGFEESSPFAGLERERLAVLDREKQSIHVLTPPDLSGARSVVGLDGTPTPMLWELVTGKDFDVVSTVKQETMSDYIHDNLGITVKQTSNHLKPYHGGHVTENRDEAILYGSEVEEGQKPALIAPNKALEKYEDAGILNRAKKSMNYAEVLSSNDFKGEPVGVIHGAPHPGNQPIKKWAAYFGASIESEGTGMEKTYGDFGDKIYRHFVHNKVLQAILRFGRGESDATVYVNTAAIPDDSIEVDSMVNPELFNSPNKRKIADCLRDAGDDGATKEDLKAVARTSMTTVENILYDFRDEGLVEGESVPGPHPTVYKWSQW